ncbi:unnamed protein product [Camellia sinensis]
MDWIMGISSWTDWIRGIMNILISTILLSSNGSDRSKIDSTIEFVWSHALDRGIGILANAILPRFWLTIKI